MLLAIRTILSIISLFLLENSLKNPVAGDVAINDFSHNIHAFYNNFGSVHVNSSTIFGCKEQAILIEVISKYFSKYNNACQL